MDQLSIENRLESFGIERGSYVPAPADRMRKVIAARMTDTIRTVPQFSLECDIDVGPLQAARSQWNLLHPEARISVNDLVVRASALALSEVPEVNASFVDDWMIQHSAADIAVVVAVPGGLMTPIVRAAQTKSVTDISAEVRDMAQRAQQRRLRPDEYVGGTFSVSNLGMYGVRRFTSIINPPQAAILSVGSTQVTQDGTSMSVTLTCDHRALDGVAGARWLQCFKRLLESPQALLDAPS